LVDSWPAAAEGRRIYLPIKCYFDRLTREYDIINDPTIKA